MQIINKNINELIPYINNPRKNDRAVDYVASSIKNFGFKVPIIIDAQNEIVAGHTRLKAAIKLNYKEVPCIVADDLTPAQIKAYRIADNKVSEYAEWDMDLLKIEIQDLDEFTGFEIEELNIMFEEEKEITEDEVPEVQKEVITKLGDLYEIGKHRLLCGDSTDSDQVAKLMNGEKADMVFTDPPYNIGFKGSMSNKMVNGKKAPADSANQRHDEIKNDAISEEQFYNFISDILKEIKINCLGAFYICFGSQTLNQLLQPLLDLGIEYKSIIIWMKNQAIFSGKDFKSRYEPIVYGRFNDFFNGARFNEEDIWQFARTQKNDLHPTMKPIPLIENALNYSSKEGMNILDLFLGSGSTMVASHQLNRKCYGMELDPKYCDVIVRRMINLDSNITIKRNGLDCKKEFIK